MIALLLVLGLDANAPTTGLDPGSTGLLRTIAPLGGELGGLAFSPDGRLLAIGCGTGVRIYETGTWRPVARLEGGSDSVECVAFSPDGRWLAAGGEDGSTFLWDVAKGKVVHALRGHLGPVHAVAFSPDGTLLLTGAEDGRARLWESASGKRLSLVDEGNGAVWAAVFSRDGSRVALAGDGDSVRLYRTQGWELERRLTSEPTAALGFSGDGRRLWAHGAGGTRQWDATTGVELRKTDMPALAGRFTPDGRFFVGGQGTEVLLWDLEHSRAPARFAHHTGGVTGVAVHPHGRLFATVGQDRHLKLWGPVAGGMSRVRGKGFLGVTVQGTADSRVAITLVYEGSAAQTAGLRTGDLLLRIGGQPVQTMAEAVDQIGSFQEGDEVEFELDRGGDVKTLKVRLGKRPPTMPN